MPRRLTRRQRIEILQNRHDYLVKKRNERVDDKRPISFITDEIRVLAWAITELTEMVDNDLQNMPSRGDVFEEFAYAEIEGEGCDDAEPVGHAEPVEKSTKEVL